MTTTMKQQIFLLPLLLLSSANGFVTPSATSSTRQHVIMQPIISSSSLKLGSFDEYSQTDPDQDLAYEDTLIGTTDGVAMEGKFVTVAYKGQLMSNNKVFDEGQISFRLGDNKVIKGWDRGLIGMKVGGKRILKIPPQLAYGDRGAGDVIPGGAHLQFDCELKGIASNAMEEKMAEASSMNPSKVFFYVFVAGSIIYDVLKYQMHVI
mmetsp:Transcript_3797/g.5833  ORF Transcript_3797/g.5833 Transcript_3797/m.5833 type:complete len:207 (+) Transcript_3797:64-684(+)